MKQRPQTQLKAPKLKAVGFLVALAGGTVVGFVAAEESPAPVVVATKSVRALAVVRTDDVRLGTVRKDAADEAARDTADVAGGVALAALSSDKPVRKADVVPTPSCAGSASSAFGVVVVPLQAPIPSTVKKGTVVQLRVSPVDTDPAPRAVFLKPVDPPKTVAPEAVAVSYAEVLVGMRDSAAFGRSTAWALLPAPPC